MGRSSVGREQLLAWVAEQAESGLSVQQFCSERQISVNSFYIWRRKALGEKLSSGAALVPVSIARGSSWVEVELPCGAVVKVLQNEACVRQVLEAHLLLIGVPYGWRVLAPADGKLRYFLSNLRGQRGQGRSQI